MRSFFDQIYPNLVLGAAITFWEISIPTWCLRFSKLSRICTYIRVSSRLVRVGISADTRKVMRYNELCSDHVGVCKYIVHLVHIVHLVPSRYVTVTYTEFQQINLDILWSQKSNGKCGPSDRVCRVANQLNKMFKNARENIAKTLRFLRSLLINSPQWIMRHFSPSPETKPGQEWKPVF